MFVFTRFTPLVCEVRTVWNHWIVTAASHVEVGHTSKCNLQVVKGCLRQSLWLSPCLIGPQWHNSHMPLNEAKVHRFIDIVKADPAFLLLSSELQHLQCGVQKRELTDWNVTIKRAPGHYREGVVELNHQAGEKASWKGTSVAGGSRFTIQQSLVCTEKQNQLPNCFKLMNSCHFLPVIHRISISSEATRSGLKSVFVTN